MFSSLCRNLLCRALHRISSNEASRPSSDDIRRYARNYIPLRRSGITRLELADPSFEIPQCILLDRSDGSVDYTVFGGEVAAVEAVGNSDWLKLCGLAGVEVRRDSTLLPRVLWFSIVSYVVRDTVAKGNVRYPLAKNSLGVLISHPP